VPALHSVGTPALWIGFTVFVLLMLALDLGVFNRRSHVVGFKESLIWSLVWIALASVFGAGIFWKFGAEHGLEFAAGYVIEKSLSVDNLFVFVVIFSAFKIPAQYQHRVLFWGVLGALVMRAVFIGLGAALLQRFHFILYVFGAILIVSAIRLWREQHETEDPKEGFAYRTLKKLIPATDQIHGQHFFIKEGGKWLATPLFSVLVVVEISDVLFAVDSIPAIFAVTEDPFIVYTSNVFAILGLRSLYFLLAGALDRFYLLKPALSIVLGFVGIKLLITDLYKIPVAVSLAVIASLLTLAILGSLKWPRPTTHVTPPPSRKDGLKPGDPSGVGAGS
jgi:tellurite resistance protein TerC